MAIIYKVLSSAQILTKQISIYFSFHPMRAGVKAQITKDGKSKQITNSII